MGLTIAFRIRLRSRSQATPFLQSALAEAKNRGWKIRKRKASDPRAVLSPHPMCEDVDIDFSHGLATEGIVKTSFAPISTHESIVEFFDALKPFCSSIKLDDETGYAKHRDADKLRAARKAFKQALEGPKDRAPVIFTGMIIRSDGTVEVTDEMKRRLAIKPTKGTKKLRRAE
jgi:hypothetical protein